MKKNKLNLILFIGIIIALITLKLVGIEMSWLILTSPLFLLLFMFIVITGLCTFVLIENHKKDEN